LPFADRARTSVRFEHCSLLSGSLYRRFADMAGSFDLIVAGNVLNEMPGKEAVSLCRLLETLLARNGVLVFIDPGTRRAFQNLMGVRETVIQNTGLTLYAPCLSVKSCPSRDTANHWCHERLEWEPPAFIQAIDRYTGFSKQKGVTYTYCTFSKQPYNVSETVTVPGGTSLWRVVSYPIKEKGRELLYVCNGEERRLLRRLSRHASVSNAGFGRAGRGDIVAVADCRERGDFYDIIPGTRFTLCAAAGEQKPFKRKNKVGMQVNCYGPQTM
jgi:ribosomal protein RSM22 (predicted rRNA methylase)